MSKSDLLIAWELNTSANWLLFDAIDAKGMKARYAERTRAVSSQFAHMHNIRVSNLERRGQDTSLQSFPRGAEPTKSVLRKALKASDKALGKLLAAFEADGNVRSWGGPPASYLGYFAAHEAHHRGLILVSLRMSGIKLPKSVTYGIWNWSRKIT